MIALQKIVYDGFQKCFGQLYEFYQNTEGAVKPGFYASAETI
jgi:hypothetical protein